MSAPNLPEERLQFEEIPVSRQVLVVGHGWTALHTARELADLGLEVLLVTAKSELGDKRDAAGYTAETAERLDQLLTSASDQSSFDLRLESRIVEFEGVAGQYRVLVEDAAGRSREDQVGGVVLAPEPELSADFAGWGLTPSETVMSLADLEARLHSPDEAQLFQIPADQNPAPVVFLLGFTHHSDPVCQQRACEAALRLMEDHGLPVLVLLDHFKVADQGVEALSQKARQAGVVFAKVTGGQPVVEAAPEGPTVRFFDEVMNQELAVRPQAIVIEETVRPPANAPELAKTLEILSDRRGFFQGDHVYNLPIYTNRTGILAVGPARGPISPAEGFQEAREAALHLYELLGAGRVSAALDRVRLDRKKCAICLTCYRVCPHRAISVVNRRPVFSDLACKVCGMCAAECPMDALQLHNYPDGRFQAELQGLAAHPTPGAEAEAPFIVVFGCRNSAREAARLAALRKLALPPGLELLEVPCAAKVDLDYVMSAFKQGADGVMVLACHPESCKSFQGSPRARERVALWQEYLAEAGLEPERLWFGTLAPGMSREFARMAQEMAAKLTEMGASPVRQALKKSA
jgi:quinone-modifying oxidoreductase, subunit QmoB